MTVTDTTFSGNSSANEEAGGGAIMVASGTATISGSTLADNATIAPGGAILNEGNLTIANSTFNGNFSPDHGGAIDNGDGATVAIENSTLSGDQGNFRRGRGRE